MPILYEQQRKHSLVFRSLKFAFSGFDTIKINLKIWKMAPVSVNDEIEVSSASKDCLGFLWTAVGFGGLPSFLDWFDRFLKKMFFE